MPVPPCIAEDLVTALIVQLLRKGAISADELAAAVADLPEESRDVALSLIVEAQAPGASEWQAQQRRARIRALPDGGN